MTDRILYKVYGIWFLRRIVPLMLLQIVILVGALKLLADTVFLGKILENARGAAHSSYWEFFKYLVGAFFQTNFLAQIFILSVLGVGALLLRDLVRIASGYVKTFRR